MKKILFLAAFLLNAGAASAVQFKVTCCDGTVVYTQGLSFEAYKEGGASKWEIRDYEKLIGETACEKHNGCARSVEQLPLTLSLEESIKANTIPETRKEKAKEIAPSKA